jgi:hypothetical protein
VIRRTPALLPLPLTEVDREERAARIRIIAALVAAGRYRVPAHRVAASWAEAHCSRRRTCGGGRA